MRQNVIAKDVGITATHLNAILNGRSNPSPDLAVRLERATGVAREIWIFGSGEERRAAWDNVSVVTKSIIEPARRTRVQVGRTGTYWHLAALLRPSRHVTRGGAIFYNSPLLRADARGRALLSLPSIVPKVVHIGPTRFSRSAKDLRGKSQARMRIMGKGARHSHPGAHCLTIKEAQARYRVSAATLYQAVRRGDITAYRPGKRILLDTSSLDTWFQASKMGSKT